ncbi:MAG: hypothetical protein K2O32_11885, partial [Acetatifactor sp.]|nr:hypothetical protein [Acetatifactor sp.]
MGVVIDIISAIIKLVVSNKVENKFISQIIGILADDILKEEAEAISDFINSESNKMNKVLSEEHLRNMYIPKDHIPYVINEMKLLLSKIELTDELWDMNKYDAKNLEKYLWERYYDSKNDSLEYEEDIKKAISDIAGTLIDIKCNSKDFERDILIKLYDSVGNQNEKLKKMEDSINDIE